MDFSKFSSIPSPPASPGYRILKGYTSEFRGYEISSIRMEDSEPIMNWRNEQMAYLKQPKALSRDNQITYFNEIVKAQFSGTHPDPILFRFTLQNKLIGYASFSNTDWANLHTRAFFLLDTERTKDKFQYGRDCSIILNLLMRVAFTILNLNKISTYSFNNRGFHFHAVEASGFQREGVLRQQIKKDGNWLDVIVASCLSSELEKQFHQ